MDIKTNKNFCDFRYIIGRSANRIKNAEFTLNGLKYYLEKNNHNNNLHSGSANFNKKTFDIIDKNDKYVLAKTFSPDGDGGFPGNLNFYLLKYFNEFTHHNMTYIDTILCFVGISDKDTIFNVTDHTYFNLSNEETILNHKLKIFTDEVCLNDNDGLATDEIINTKNTAFDFTKEKSIKECLDLGHSNIKIGLDHNFCFENKKIEFEKFDVSVFNDIFCNNNINIKINDFYIHPMCELSYNNKKLIVLSDYKNLQVYTANSRDEIDENNIYRGKYSTIALEAQFCPNSINYEKFENPILKKNEIGQHIIIYRKLLI